MENFNAQELYVLRADGTVDASTPTGAAEARPSWVPRVERELEGRERCQLAVNELGVTLEAWRLVSPGQPDSEAKTLVVVRRRPPWLQDCTITPRQREISEYAAGGATVGEIASHFAISLHTVRSHLKTVYKELGVCNRIELARALSLLPC